VNLADEPAFPVPGRADRQGMTLLEHYAGLAMKGLASRNGDQDSDITAKQAVRMAKNLIAELEKKA
jgi:hypothetical protein